MLTKPVVLYDGGCSFCRSWVERIRAWDRAQKLELVPYQERARVAGMPALATEDVAAALHLVMPNGRIFRGGRAVWEVLGHIPRWRWVRPLLWIPGMGVVIDRAYAWVAARRHRW